jgi:hypothetical protein
MYDDLTARRGETRERGEADRRLEIDEGQTLSLTTISCDVYLKTQQAQDPELVAARDLVGRAADIIGRLEDGIIFHGEPGRNGKLEMPDGSLVVEPAVYEIRQGNPGHPGLLKTLANQKLSKQVRAASVADAGDPLVSNIGDAIQSLESFGHYGPFACVLGHDLYVASVTPNQGSLVLPSDRITPMLDGPLLRSGTVPPGQGVVVALAGAPVDLVVASDVHVSFLQRTLEPRYVLRVSERFVLRIKQAAAVCQLELMVGGGVQGQPGQPGQPQPGQPQQGQPGPDQGP